MFWIILRENCPRKTGLFKGFPVTCIKCSWMYSIRELALKTGYAIYWTKFQNRLPFGYRLWLLVLKDSFK